MHGGLEPALCSATAFRCGVPVAPGYPGANEGSGRSVFALAHCAVRHTAAPFARNHPAAAARRSSRRRRISIQSGPIRRGEGARANARSRSLQIPRGESLPLHQRTRLHEPHASGGHRRQSRGHAHGTATRPGRTPAEGSEPSGRATAGQNLGLAAWRRDAWRSKQVGVRLAGFHHVDDVTQMPFGTLESIDEVGVSLVEVGVSLVKFSLRHDGFIFPDGSILVL